jgi:hypothetical protein
MAAFFGRLEAWKKLSFLIIWSKRYLEWEGKNLLKF